MLSSDKTLGPWGLALSLVTLDILLLFPTGSILVAKHTETL